MEESITVRIDKSVSNLMKTTVWANLICIALFVAVNVINLLRGNFTAAQQNSGRQMLSPDILLLLSVVCIIWLIVRTLSVLRTARRMENVFLTIEGDRISGVSLPEPASASREAPNGRPFTLTADVLTNVYSKEMTIIKKQVAPALYIETENATYVLPGLDRISEVKTCLLKLMDAAASKCV